MLEMYKSFGVPGPYAILLTLVGLDGYHLLIGNTGAMAGPVHQREMFFDEVILYDHDYSFTSLVVALKPIFDRLANAAGLERCRFISVKNDEYVVAFDMEGNVKRV